MNSNLSEDELRRQADELRKREYEIRLQELEAELEERSQVTQENLHSHDLQANVDLDSPFGTTRRHIEPTHRRPQSKAMLIAKLVLLGVVMVAVVYFINFLAAVIIVGMGLWLAYLLFFKDGDR